MNKESLLNIIPARLCANRFKNQFCGYSGPADYCDKTLSNCRALGNESRFNGYESKADKIDGPQDRISFDHYFMALAKLAACRSGCNSRPTGSVLTIGKRVLATGYNGTLPGQKQCKDFGPTFCLRRSLGKDDTGGNKYLDCPAIHAEQNAINQIARYGGRGLEGATCYTTLFPCIHCLKNIASVGIVKVYFELHYSSNDTDRDEYWRDQARVFGVEVEQIKIPPETYSAIAGVMYRDTSERRL